MASTRSAINRVKNPPALLFASEGVAVVSITAYDMIASGNRKLPDPRNIIAALAFYALLALVGGFSAGAARVSAAIGALLALTLLVTGRRGAGLVGLLQRLTGQAQTAPAAPAPAPTG